MRYAINGAYSKYLEKRLNEISGEEVFLGEELARRFYGKGFSLVHSANTVTLCATMSETLPT